MKSFLYAVVAAVVVLTNNAHAICDTCNVPDGGLTVSMLSMAVGGLFLFRKSAR